MTEENKRMGRPPLPEAQRKTTTSFAISNEHLAFIRNEAKRLGVSASEVLARCVEAYKERAR